MIQLILVTSLLISSWCIGDTIHLSADKFTLNGNDQFLQARSSVTITNKDMRLRCTTMHYDQVNHIIYASGRVNFYLDSIAVTTNQLTYHIANKTVEFSGTSQVKQGTDYLKGSHFVVNLSDKTVISSGRTKVNISVDRVNQ